MQWFCKAEKRCIISIEIYPAVMCNAEGNISNKK